MKNRIILFGLICSMLIVSGCNLNQEPVVIQGNVLPNITLNIIDNYTSNVTNVFNKTQVVSNVTNGNIMFVQQLNKSFKQVNILDYNNVTSNFTSNQTNITS